VSQAVSTGSNEKAAGSGRRAKFQCLPTFIPVLDLYAGSKKVYPVKPKRDGGKRTLGFSTASYNLKKRLSMTTKIHIL
jgi:hypothetical protein